MEFQVKRNYGFTSWLDSHSCLTISESSLPHFKMGMIVILAF